MNINSNNSTEKYPEPPASRTGGIDKTNLTSIFGQREEPPPETLQNSDARKSQNGTVSHGSDGGHDFKVGDVVLPPPVIEPTEFDPAKLALPQNFTEMAAVKKEIITIPIRKPGSQVWLCIHTDECFRMTVGVVELKQDREHYIVHPAIQDELAGEWIPKLLVTCQTRQGAIFLWPIRLPDAAGRIDTWNASALEIIKSHAGQWIRVTSNAEIGSYDVLKPIAPPAAPGWSLAPEDIFSRAFKNRVITTTEHPVVRQLRGDV